MLQLSAYAVTILILALIYLIIVIMMSQSDLTAKQLRDSEGNSHRYNIFQTLLQSSAAVPLDNQGIFSLVRTEHYQEQVALME